MSTLPQTAAPANLSAPAALSSSERPLTTTNRCDVCETQAFMRVVLASGELFFCAHHAREHGQRLKDAALLYQDETARLMAD